MSPDEFAGAVTDFMERGQGPLASNLFEVGLFLNCDGASPFPDVRCISRPTSVPT